MSGADSALHSLSYEEVAALSGEAPMAARSGVARGGGAGRGFPLAWPSPSLPPTAGPRPSRSSELFGLERTRASCAISDGAPTEPAAICISRAGYFF
jgi:hypothetical protein